MKIFFQLRSDEEAQLQRTIKMKLKELMMTVDLEEVTSKYVRELFNTLRPRQNGRHFANDIFNCISLNENFRILNKISLKYIP